MVGTASGSQFWDHSTAGLSLPSEVASMSQSWYTPGCDKYWSPPGVLFWGHRAGRRLLDLHHPQLQASKLFVQPNSYGIHFSYMCSRTCSDAFEVFANTLLRHCWYYLQLPASIYNEITHYSCHWNLYNLQSRGICSFVLLCGNRSISESLL